MTCISRQMFSWFCRKVLRYLVLWDPRKTNLYTNSTNILTPHGAIMHQRLADRCDMRDNYNKITKTAFVCTCLWTKNARLKSCFIQNTGWLAKFAILILCRNRYFFAYVRNRLFTSGKNINCTVVWYSSCQVPFHMTFIFDYLFSAN